MKIIFIFVRVFLLNPCVIYQTGKKYCLIKIRGEHKTMKTNNILTKTIGGLFTLAIIFFAANNGFAQIANIKAKEKIHDSIRKRIIGKNFKKEIKGNNNESFYIFEVGQGETVLDITVKAYQENAGVEITFTDENNRDVADLTLVQAIQQGTESQTVTINSGKKRLITMKIKEQKYGSQSSYPGKLTINFSGSFIGWD
jgi:hypothetical protein